MPPVVPNTNATGSATLTLLDDGNTMSYSISGSNVGNVKEIALKYYTGQVPPPPILLFHYAVNEGLLTQGTGTIEGNFTTADFLEQFKGKTMSDLVNAINNGNIYIEISTEDLPTGEIGGKVESQPQ
ncbi:MAG TPA: CHRD domain-containing protein [Nitrososphaeraceae archaeon]